MNPSSSTVSGAYEGGAVWPVSTPRSHIPSFPGLRQKRDRFHALPFSIFCLSSVVYSRPKKKRDPRTRRHFVQYARESTKDTTTTMADKHEYKFKIAKGGKGRHEQQKADAANGTDISSTAAATAPGPTDATMADVSSSKIVVTDPVPVPAPAPSADPDQPPLPPPQQQQPAEPSLPPPTTNVAASRMMDDELLESEAAREVRPVCLPDVPQPAPSPPPPSAAADRLRAAVTTPRKPVRNPQASYRAEEHRKRRLEEESEEDGGGVEAPYAKELSQYFNTAPSGKKGGVDMTFVVC